MKGTLTSKELKNFLHYDQETGVFTWKVDRTGKAKKGCVAGSINKVTGYRSINLCRKRYYAHRLAFLYMLGKLPALDVDHIDGDKDNNSWSNLREANDSQNVSNQKARSKSGVKNVYRNRNKWAVQVSVNRKKFCFGTYPTIEEASRVAEQARIELHGRFANHDSAK